MIPPGAFSDSCPVGPSLAFAQSWRLALTSSPTARNAAPIAAKPARHDLVPASDSTTTGGPRAAPSAHDACSQPMYLTPRVKEICVFTLASIRPEPAPARKLTTGTIHHSGAKARPSHATVLRPQPPTSRPEGASRPVRGPLAALARKYASVKVASRRPRPASGAPKEARMYGQATPIAPAGSPSATKVRSGMLFLIHGSAAGRRRMPPARTPTYPCVPAFRADPNPTGFLQARSQPSRVVRRLLAFL